MSAQTNSSKAAAEALFQQATELFARGEYEKACPKFEASQALDPALGTTLRLADCLDRTGKTASAWGLFLEAAAIAQNRGEGERAELARERAQHLEPRLSKLELHFESDALPDVEVRLNDVTIPNASLDTPLPVDPGHLKVSVSAPGRKPWSADVQVPEGPALTKLEIPPLEVQPNADTSSGALAPAPLRAQRASSSGSPVRTLGFVSAGVGLLGLAGGGVMAFRARELNAQSLDECDDGDASACSKEGHELRQDAFVWADAATVSFVAGSGLLLTGIVLVLVAPSESVERPAGLQVAASTLPSGAHVSLGGAW